MDEMNREAPSNPECLACGGAATHQAYFGDGTSYPACDSPACQPEDEPAEIEGDGNVLVHKTCARWVAERGRGFLCTTEY